MNLSLALVTVLTFASGFPRITEAITAARAASRLGDPRFSQVFDVEDVRRARLRGAGVGGRRVTAGHAGRRPPGRPERRVAAVRGGPGHRGGARWRAGPPAAEPGVPALDARQRGQDHRPGHRRGAGRPAAGRGRKWAERRRWARIRTGPRAHRHPGPGPAAVRRADRLLARLAGTGRVRRRRGADRPPGRRSGALSISGPGCPRRRRPTGCRAPRARYPRPSRPTSTP